MDQISLVIDLLLILKLMNILVTKNLYTDLGRFEGKSKRGENGKNTNRARKSRRLSRLTLNMIHKIVSNSLFLTRDYRVNS